VGTPTALVDGQTGLVAEQYAIGPFGECGGLDVLSGSAAAGPVLKIGYQGLFTDRLDAMLGKPVLVPGARTLVHNRARVYMPRLGRFLQQDPNMAGIALPGSGVAALPNYGMPPAALACDIDPLRQYRDGTNLYAAVGGNPLGQRDPRGLFFSLGEVNFSASTAADLDSDWAQDVVSVGQTIADSLGTIYANYAVDQFLDRQWAMDWSEPDDLYRGSASWSAGTGSWESEGAHSIGSNGQVMAKVFSLGPKGANKIIKEMQEGVKGRGVYAILDSTGKVLYVGRSRNLQERMKISKALHGGDRAVGINTTNKGTTRALEDLLIRSKDLINNGQNKINGMSDATRESDKGRRYYRELQVLLSELSLI
jgi:hypothetical protein